MARGQKSVRPLSYYLGWCLIRFLGISTPGISWWKQLAWPLGQKLWGYGQFSGSFDKWISCLEWVAACPPWTPCLLTKWSHLSPLQHLSSAPASVGNEIGTWSASIYDNFRRDFMRAGMSANLTLASDLRTVFENDKPATKDDAPKIIFRSKYY